METVPDKLEALIIMSESKFRAILREELDRKIKPIPVIDRIMSLNACCRRLNVSHTKIRNLIKSGIIRTTSDGKIPESSIREYLNGN
jgi:hypothetical protein